MGPESPSRHPRALFDPSREDSSLQVGDVRLVGWPTETVTARSPSTTSVGLDEREGVYGVLSEAISQ
jgi:hypothetical protein